MMDPAPLQAVCDEVFRLVAGGVADRRSPFRSPALGTAGADGVPRVRTVVLRAFDPGLRRAVVHSDARAAKIGELAADPRAALHVWDGGCQVQVQLTGIAARQPDDVARAEWAGLHAGSRATYCVRPAPGTPLDDPALADADRLDEDAAYANFAVIHLEVTGIEWLHLAQDGHRRAAFTWAASGWHGVWLVP